MKKQLYFLALPFLLFMHSLMAQQNIFSKKYTDLATFAGYNIIQAYDNSFMIAGEEAGLPMVMKVDSAGNYVWGKNYGTTNNSVMFDINTHITQTHDSCFVFTTDYFNPADSVIEVLCVKINQAGDTLWSSILPDSVPDYPLSIQQTYDHGYIIAGYSIYSTAPLNRTLVIKIDSAGNLQWRKVLTTGNYSNIAYDVKQTPDSGYVVIASYENTLPNHLDAELIKLSETGNQMWAMAYNRQVPVQLYGQDLEIMPTGIVCLMSLNYSLVLVKTDFSGNISWIKPYGYYCDSNIGWAQNYTTHRIHKTSDGGLIINIGGGYFGNMSTLKTDSLGNYNWSNAVWNIEQEVIQVKDSGYIALGNGPIMLVKERNTKMAFLNELALVKTDSLGYTSQCVTGGINSPNTDSIIAIPVLVGESSGGTSMSFHPTSAPLFIAAAYGCIDIGGDVVTITKNNDITISPNPFTSTTTITFSEEQKNTSIKVMNILGESVFTSPPLRGGREGLLDLSTFAKGIYFVRIENENKNVVNKKIIKE